jgi:hypothetical protein
MNLNIRKLKIAAAAAIGLCILTLTTTAQAAEQRLHNWLCSNNIVSRLVKLDRSDGFSYGLSLSGPETPCILIAPGKQRMWLVNIEGEEAILQADALGRMLVIAQTDDFWIYLCYIKKITEFLLSAPGCTTPLCYTDKVLNLFMKMKLCVPPAAS